MSNSLVHSVFVILIRTVPVGETGEEGPFVKDPQPKLVNHDETGNLSDLVSALFADIGAAFGRVVVTAVKGWLSFCLAVCNLVPGT